jgi:hypothetical protein
MKRYVVTVHELPDDRPADVSTLKHRAPEFAFYGAGDSWHTMIMAPTKDGYYPPKDLDFLGMVQTLAGGVGHTLEKP